MEVYKDQDIRVEVLTKNSAEKYIDKILDFVSQIPKVHYTKEELLADSKPGRDFLAKWDRSLALFQNEELIGIIMGYERKAEENDQYPDNCIYISELALDPSVQGKGYGKLLVQKFLEYNGSIPFKFLNGPIIFSVQTNSAEFNLKVRKLYESFGFKKVSEKVYDNRIDNVYQLKITNK